MRPKGSAKELEVRRQIAANMLEQGMGIREVARLVKASPSSVFKWKQRLAENGREGLKPKPGNGRKAVIKAEQKEQLEEILLKGARAAGYPTELWTLNRITAVIKKEFGIQYHPGHVWKILRGMGWSAQKPERRARERNEAEIERWRKEEWPRIKKQP
jgi:transposase